MASLLGSLADIARNTGVAARRAVRDFGREVQRSVGLTPSQGYTGQPGPSSTSTTTEETSQKQITEAEIAAERVAMANALERQHDKRRRLAAALIAQEEEDNKEGKPSRTSALSGARKLTWLLKIPFPVWIFLLLACIFSIPILWVAGKVAPVADFAENVWSGITSPFRGGNKDSDAIAIIAREYNCQHNLDPRILRSCIEREMCTQQQERALREAQSDEERNALRQAFSEIEHCGYEISGN